MSATLTEGTVENVLNFLQIDYMHERAGKPNIALLDALVAAYVQKVPWESASRIVRRAEINAIEECPRWPEEFWQLAMARGLGGTCFESNYAFFALLQSLGYDGHLTINNMGETIGCHTAIVLNIDGERWMADVGIPVHLPVRLDPAVTTHRDTPYLRYSAWPDGEKVFQIERAPHPKPNVFTLIASPVKDEAYRAATIADYGPNGHFLNELIINKVIDGQIWRCSTRDAPLHLETFVNGERNDTPLEGDLTLVGRVVADKFGMDAAVITGALRRV